MKVGATYRKFALKSEASEVMYMARIVANREGNPGAVLVAQLRDAEVKSIISPRADTGLPEIKLFSEDELREIIASSNPREVAHLGITLSQGPPLSKQIGISLLAALSIVHCGGTYNQNILENRGLTAQQAGDALDALTQVQDHNQEVSVARSGEASITKQVWDPFDVLRSNMVIRNVDKVSDAEVPAQNPFQSDSAATNDANDLGTEKVILDKMASTAHKEGIPYGIHIYNQGRGATQVTANVGDRQLFAHVYSGVRSMCADNGSLLIQYRDPKTGELRYDEYSTPADGIEPQRREITEAKMAEGFGKAAEAFGIMKKKRQ